MDRRLASNMTPIALVVVWLLLFWTDGRTNAQVAEQPTSPSLVQTRSGPDIYLLHVQTEIAYRFATTQVICRLANRSPEAKEAVFAMTIPKTAFITSFVMTIDGVDYPGEVKEKVKAKRQYEAAKRRGESAGRVSAAQTRNTFQFRVAVSVAAESKVDYNLTYQELLQRKLGYYEYVLNIDPGHVVRDLRVDVYIRESREITDVRVPPIKRNSTEVVDMSKENPHVSIIRDGRSAYHILYDPDPSVQLQQSDRGVSGQLIVQYDVSRATDAGEIQVIDGYFVHYFAPSGLEPVNKNVLFVIDVSGSMAGDKIRQTKDAMYTILDDLREGDMFNIITFSSYVTSWSDGVREATPDNIRQAKAFVKEIQADGGTNINDALLRGVGFLEEESAKEWEKRPSMLILLTDGEPTSGITTTSRILSNVRKANRGRYSVFSLGFGHDLDFQLLQRVSLQNKGVARRIYADADADLQLEGFYSELSTPVLSDVEVVYVGGAADARSLTATRFPAYFRGSEIVVAGRLRDGGVRSLGSRVRGHAAGGYMQFDADVRIAKVERDALQTAYSNFTERLWAFMTIRKLLDSMLQTTNSTEKAEARRRALDLALKYSFVTPLTSMVVTKPEEPTRNFGNIQDDDEEEDEIGRHSSRSRLHYLTSRKSTPSGSTSKRRPSFVDNDPHFIIHVQGISEAICFNLDGPPGLVYQLLYDKKSGTVINGLVVGKDVVPKGHKYPRTYIGELMILRKGVSVHVTPHAITYRSRRTEATLRWDEHGTLADKAVGVFVEGRTKAFVRLGGDVVFAVLQHLVGPGHRSKVDFLGLYVIDQRGLSSYCHGLIGQFLHQTASLHKSPDSRQLATLRMRGPHNSHKVVTAKEIQRRDMDRKDHVTCWNVRNNGRGLLDGLHTDYVVPSLLHKRPVLLHYRMAKLLFGNSSKFAGRRTSPVTPKQLSRQSDNLLPM